MPMFPILILLLINKKVGYIFLANHIFKTIQKFSSSKNSKYVLYLFPNPQPITIQ